MEKTCFLFGHADTPQWILPALEKAVEKAVLNGVTTFYVGNHGSFDCIAATALRAVKRRYGSITLMLVLAYHPAERSAIIPLDFDGSFYPPLEHVPHKYAIVRANQYLISNSDCVICYVCHPGNTCDLLKKQKENKSRSTM